MKQPTTPTGRKLFTDNEPGDMLESDGVTPDDIVAIENEVREQVKAEVERIMPSMRGGGYTDQAYNLARRQILAILDGGGQPDIDDIVQAGSGGPDFT